jgi:cell division protein FtsB
MPVDRDVMQFVLVFFGSISGFWLGWLTKTILDRRSLARAAEHITENADPRIDALLDEMQELRAHVADLTLMLDDARSQVPRAPEGSATRDT